jgi:hypothetical protein
VSVLAVFCLLAGFGCDRTVQWERSFGGPDRVSPVEIIRSPDSGYVLLANIKDKWTGAEGVWLLRLDDDGDTLWTRTFIISAATRADAILPSPDGGFLVSGRSGYVPYLMRVRSDGMVLMGDTWPEFQDAGPCLVTAAADSTVFMVGEAGWQSIFVQRAMSAGYAFWDTTYTLAYEPGFRDLVRAEGGSCFVCGEDFGMVLSAVGESLWTMDYSNLGPVDFHAAAAASDGGFFLGGFVYTETGSRIICVRISSTGEVVWSRRVDDPPAGGRAVCASGDGGCYVGGETDATDTEDGILVKFDAGGNIEWQREFNGPQYGAVAAVTETPDGDLLLLTGANEELRVLRVQP